MGFRLRRLPAKQQPQGPRGSPATLCQTATGGVGCENGLRSFPEFWPLGVGVCSPMSVSCPFADCSPQELGWCRWGDGASVLSGTAWLGWHCWGLGAEGLRTPNPVSCEGGHAGSGFQAPEIPSKAAGARGPEAAQPRFARHGAAGWMPKRLALLSSAKARWGWCCSTRNVSCPFADCSTKKLGWCHWGDRASRLSGPACLGGITGAWV